MNALKHMKILYIDDRNSNNEHCASELKTYCKNVIEVSDCKLGLKVYEEERPEIVIYNVSVPSIPSEEFIKNLKNIDKKAQLIITTSDLTKEKIYNAINFHLIKYLVYPFNLNSLLDSLKDCITSIDSNTSNIIKLNEVLTYDKFNKVLLKKEEIISLSKKESIFFDILIKNKDRAVCYEEFNQQIWQGEMTKDALRSIVKDLRKKIDKNIIKNVSGIGYRVNL